MSLKEPIVEGAYYLREDEQVFGPAARELCNGLYLWRVGPCLFTGKGGSVGASRGMRLTRRVWITHTDPAEVVAELRRRSSECEPPGDVYGEEANFQSGRSDAFDASAEAVESMFGLARCGEGCDGNCELTTYGPTKAETEIAELRSKAAEIVAELRAEVADLARHNWNEYIRDRSEALNHAADLVAEKLVGGT